MKRTTTRNSYIGEDVFVGIDVHKKTYYVVARVNQETAKKMDGSSITSKISRATPEIF